MEEVISTTKNKVEKTGKIVSTKGLDYIITGSIALIFLLCPLFVTGLVSQGMGFEKMILFYLFVLIGLVAWVTKGVILGELNIKRTPLDIPIIVTLTAYVVATIFSVSNKDSLLGSYGNSAKGLVALIIFILFYYLLVNNLNVAKIKIVFWSLLTSSSIMSIYSLLQLRKIYLMPMDFTHAQSFNTIGTLSGLTMYLVIVLPLLTIAMAQIKEIAPRLGKISVLIIRILIGLAILSLMIVLAMLNGFTWWPAAIVGAVIMLMFFMSKIIKISNNDLIIPLVVFLSLIILWILGSFNVDSLKLPAEVSLSRSASWEITKNSIKENPFLGSGPSTFYYDFSKFKNADFNSTALWNVRFDSATGIFFELLTTVGIFGAVSILVLILITLSILFISLIKTTERGANSILLGFFASFISILFFAILFSQNNSMILLGMVIGIFAVAASIILYPEKFTDLKLSFRSSPKYALALAAIFLCVSAGVVVLFTMGLKMYIADKYAQDAMNTKDLLVKIEKLNKAINFAPYQDSYYLAAADAYMAAANEAAVGNKDQNTVITYLQKAIENGKTAKDIAPMKADNNEALALIYENASFYTRGALEEATKLYGEVSKLDPQSPTPSLRTALINMANANNEQDKKEQEYFINEAIKKYDEALSKKSDLAAAYYGKAIAYEKLQNIDQAIDQLYKANIESRNTNVDYRFELGRLYFNRGVSPSNMGQNASQQIAERDITSNQDGNASGTAEALSVQPTKTNDTVLKMNDDLKNAENLFLNIIQVNPKHANARYSLAVLYQKIGEKAKAKEQINSLLTIIPDQQTKEIITEQFKDIL